MRLRFIAITVLAKCLTIQVSAVNSEGGGGSSSTATVVNKIQRQQQQQRRHKRLGDRVGDGMEEENKSEGRAGDSMVHLAADFQGPSDCCEPPKNLPPDVVAQLLDAMNNGGEAGVGVDIPKDAIESGKDHKSDPAPLDSLVITVDAAAVEDEANSASATILESLGIDITDTSMEGGGFNPAITTMSERTEGGIDAVSITNYGEVIAPQGHGMLETMMDKPVDWDFFPRTGIEESELIEYPVDEQLLAFGAEGSLVGVQVENKEEDLAVARVNIFSSKEESDARKLHTDGVIDDSHDRHRRRGSLPSYKQDDYHRNLQVSQGINTAPIGLFNPLACNANIATASCSDNKLSTLLSGSTAAVTVPCGKCYTYDLSTTTPIAIGGLDIRGKLYIPPNYKSTLLTRFVFVQGVLEMSDTNPISKNNTSMKIILTGNTDVTFVPADSNANVVGGTFNAGVKPFLVAGGQLNVRGWTGSLVEGGPVETWTPMLDMLMAAPPNVTLSSVPGKESTPLAPPLALIPNTGGERLQCPRKLVSHNFDTSVDYRVWSGGEGKIIDQVNGTIVLKNLRTSWQGFKLDFR